MTREEFGLLVKGMKAVYTQDTFIPDRDAFDIWFKLLEDLPYELANKATLKHMMTGKFPPTPADIRAKAAEYSAEPRIQELEAWSLVRRAIKNSAYSADEEFEKLPEACKIAVGSPDNLRHWGMVDSEQVSTVIQSNFLRAYRNVIEREAENSKLPPAMRVLIQTAFEHTAPQIENNTHNGIEEHEGVEALPEVLEFLRSRGVKNGLEKRNQGG